MASSSSARKLIPKRLEDELKDIPRFKPKMAMGGVSAQHPPTMRDVMDDSIERAMYDQILGPLINRRPSSVGTHLGSSSRSSSRPGISQQQLSASTSSTVPPPSLTSDSFNTSLLTRLSLVEGDNKDLRRQLAEKVLRIEQLERDNRRLRAQVDASSSSAVSKAAELMTELEAARSHGAELELQVEEMEQFLNDYGLVWVGSQAQDERQQQRDRDREKEKEREGRPSPGKLLQRDLGSGSSSPSPATATATAKSATGVNFHDFAAKVSELNRIIASEPTQIKLQGPGGRTARLQHATEAVEHIPVTFFRNGLLVRRGPFREVGSPGYTSFVRDVMDGYFPGEYRCEYPDGVILELKDRHAEDYQPGAGEHQMSSSQLLRRMPPAVVVRNGELVNIRDEVDRLLQQGTGTGTGTGAGSTGSGIATASSVAATGGVTKKSPVVMLVTPAASASPTSALVTFVTVTVRWIDGSSLQAKMFPDELVGDVREHVTRHFAQAKANISGANGGNALPVPAFELRAAYPPRRLDDHMTLDEAGLRAGGVVHAKKIE